jgi:glycosyltransferase involved in cell wall biosynthesis
MKICIIGPGYMNIPPKGWGAVEILIDDYRKTLQDLGHHVDIVNTRDANLIVSLTNALNPDFVHIQYEEYAFITKYLNCRNIAITSHYAYLEQPDKWNQGYNNIFWNTVNSNSYIFALSQGIADIYVKAGVNKNKVKVISNGVRLEKYIYRNECERPNESIYLAKIETRKRQEKFQNLSNVNFVGNYGSSSFDIKNLNYLGEWSKEKLYKNLTSFANLVLFSDGEAHPLVCMEALASGLGLVISEYCTANLDLSKEFITVIPESKIYDMDFVTKKIEENKLISIKMRSEIRKYAERFDWQERINNDYLPTIKNICGF